VATVADYFAATCLFVLLPTQGRGARDGAPFDTYISFFPLSEGGALTRAWMPFGDNTAGS